MTVRVARVTAEKLRAWAEEPGKIDELIDRLVDHWSNRPELGEFFGGFCGGVGASRSYCFVFPGAFGCLPRVETAGARRKGRAGDSSGPL
jgi:hypothetical protein